MRAIVALFFVFTAASSAGAQSLANRAAEIFEQACLSDPVLALGNGTSSDDGAYAAFHAGNVFAQYDAQRKATDLRGTPKYVSGSGDGLGTFSCYVASKNLEARDVTKKFNRLKRIAGGGQKATYIGPAKFDDDPDRYIEGKRVEFESEGRNLRLELFYFIAEQGPVGALHLTLEHKISR